MPDTDQALVATKQTTEAAEAQSIQRRAEPRTTGSGVAMAPGLMWFTRQLDGSDVAPWGTPGRDNDLRRFYKLPGNDILQGANSSMVKKIGSMNFTLTGPQRVVNRYQKVLSEAEFGSGWLHLLKKVLTDYNTQDRGAFIELIGAGDPSGPITGPVIGLAHLDAQYCQLTGDPTYPVIFHNTKDGQPHKLHTTRVVHIVDMPDPDENMLDTGFCAVSRVIASSQVLLKLARYKNEKLDDLPEAGLLLLNNILESQFDDVQAEYQRERRTLRQTVYSNVMRLFSIDPEKPASAQLVSFANLPDAFNERESIELYVNIVALSFGVDVREFWPMSSGSLGTAAESLVQHQKAKGKGIGDIIAVIERAINWKVLPPSVEFAFDFQDDEEDRMRAEINKIKTETIMSMLPVVSPEVIQQMLADSIDYFKPEFLTTDMTDEVELFDTEREEKAYWDFGPVVTIDRWGRYLKARAHKLLSKMRGFN